MQTKRIGLAVVLALALTACGSPSPTRTAHALSRPRPADAPLASAYVEAVWSPQPEARTGRRCGGWSVTAD